MTYDHRPHHIGSDVDIRTGKNTRKDTGKFPIKRPIAPSKRPRREVSPESESMGHTVVPRQPTTRHQIANSSARPPGKRSDDNAQLAYWNSVIFAPHRHVSRYAYDTAQGSEGSEMSETPTESEASQTSQTSKMPTIEVLQRQQTPSLPYVQHPQHPQHQMTELGPQPAAAPPPIPAPKPAIPGATAPDTDPFGTLLSALYRATDDRTRQQATVALTAWCREHLVDLEQLADFVQSNLGNDEKTRVIGELRAEIARNEFLLGWTFEGGVLAGGDNGWENIAANRGRYPDHYTEAVATYGRENGAYWCTSMSGYTATRLGFAAAPGTRDTSMFWSGYRLDRWARTGQNNSGIQITPRDQRVTATDNASAVIHGNDWQTLHDSLQALYDQSPLERSDGDFIAALRQTIDAFFHDHITPQAGDMFVYDDDNRIHGHSHTNMVERYDATTSIIYTIGGNEGHAIGGRAITLTDPAQVRRLASMIRIGAEFYTGLPATASGAAASSSATVHDQAMPPSPASAQPAFAPPGPKTRQRHPGHERQGATADVNPPQRPRQHAVVGGQEASHLANAGATAQGIELVRHAREINERLVPVLQECNYIQSGDANAVVLAWQTGSITGNSGTGDR